MRSWLVALVVLLIWVVPALGAQPSHFQTVTPVNPFSSMDVAGYLTVNGSPAEAGTEIGVRANGNVVGAAVVERTAGGQAVFSVNVYADPADTLEWAVYSPATGAEAPAPSFAPAGFGTDMTDPTALIPDGHLTSAVAALYPAAEAPATISVPTASTSPSFSISWAASGTTGASYVLEEATDSGFTVGLRTAFSGTATSALITGKANGTYYYRVKTVAAGHQDSTWTVGGNGCTVAIPPPVTNVSPPTYIVVPNSSTTGTYSVRWGESATYGATYVLVEATNSAFTAGVRTAYTGTALNAQITGKTDGNYYYRVKATKSGLTDSFWVSGGNPCAVATAPPVPDTVAAPSRLSVPATSSTGTFRLTWTRSTTTGVTYTVEESTSATFASGVKSINAGPSTSLNVSGKESGTYYYRVKAVKSGSTDSPWTDGSNGCVVSLQADAPGRPSVPSSDNDGSYGISWSVSSTVGVTYVLEESSDSGFGSQVTEVYRGSSAGTTLNNRPEGTWYYRVKAIKTGYDDSSWMEGSNGCTVNLGLEAPTSISVPTSDDDGTYPVRWGVSPSNGVSYVVEEASNASFSANRSTVYSGPLTSTTIVNQGAGTWYYRVKAVKTGFQDSPWKASTVGCVVAGPAGPDGLRYTDSDTGLMGVARSDGGSDADNLSGILQRPSWDLSFDFQVVLQDNSGSPPSQVRLVLDGYVYDLAPGTGNLSRGVVYSRSLKLGPAAEHRFHFEARDGSGNILYRLPAAGEATGPAIALLNGYSLIGVPGALGATSVNPANLGGEKVYRWDSSGLDTGSSHGDWVAAEGSSIQPGEGFFLKRTGAGATLPALAQVGANTSAETAIPLQAGWNIISNPYGGQVSLSSVRVRREGGTTMTWAQAASSSWVINALYGYKGSDWGGLYEFSSAGGNPEAVLVPWRAYWIYLSRNDGNYSLLIPRPE